MQKSGEENTLKLIRTLNPNEHFGELALIKNEKRSLSCRVSSKEGARLLSLDRETFMRILGSIDELLKK